MSVIKEFSKNLTLQAKIFIIATTLLVSIIIIVSIINLLPRQSQSMQDSIEVTNFSETLTEDTIPDYYKSRMQQLIWQSVKDTLGASSPEQIPVTIRKDSVKQNIDGRYTLLADIESLHYSFRISFLPEPENASQNYFDPSFTIECPYPYEVIYPGTTCPIGTPVDQVKRYLPATISFNGMTIEAEMTEGARGYYIIAKVNTCSEEAQEEGEIYFRNWLKQLNFDPNDFTIVPTKTCYNNN